MINYYDLDKDSKLRFKDFLLILLPCEDKFNRAKAS